METNCEAFLLDQVTRKDILTNMLLNTHLKGNGLFNLIMRENNGGSDDRRKGWIFETLSQLLIILKCIENINYTEIYDGQLQNLKQLKNINNLLKIKVDGGGNNIVDMTIKNINTLVLFTIKYKNKYSETDVSKIDNTITKQNISNNYKIALIVKDKELVINHKYKNKLNIDKQIHDKIIHDMLLFDEKDIIKALDIFCERFSSNTINTDEFVDYINAEYLLSARQHLIMKFHQKMTELKFINSFLTNKYKMWCIAHKPRSGKSITLLLICNYLLVNGYNKILIMTSVPATINSFVNDLEKYIGFKNINYKLQDELDTVDDKFNGICFCSVQYLKIDGKNKKKNFLCTIGFDAIITDESHQGSSTDKTKNEILEIDADIEEIRKNIKLSIFASGTSDKTKKYYSIPNTCVYEWEIEDEAYMKELDKNNLLLEDKYKIIEYMNKRHGPIFNECLNYSILNKDYSKHPTQVLMKHNISQELIDEIKEYNIHHNTDFGYSCSSLFALKEIINDKNEVEYAEEFEICKENDGINILTGFFDCIISNNPMRQHTIMKQIEHTQTARGSRKSTQLKPLLFIIYLPTHTRNNTISLLQKTIKKFLETHHLWRDYNVEYSNSTEDTGIIKEEYNEYIQSIMNKTKNDNKRGCILLLGNKGTVGITYHDCDVTISLDDGHNLDNQKQRFSRALTEAYGKTIGINVDMNIQRTYLYLIDVIQKHRLNTNTDKTNAEILYYLFEHNIFLFNPQQFNNGNCKTIDILSYYKTEAENIIKEIDDTPFLDNLVCDDDMRNFIKTDFQTLEHKNSNTNLDGDQQDCPKGGKSSVEIDKPSGAKEPSIEPSSVSKEENEKIELLINQTYEMCKSFLFPLLAVISRSYKIFDFKEIFINIKTENLIISLLKDKKIELNKENYNIIVNIMNNIIDNNLEIVNNIREIYLVAPGDKLRLLIAKHFIPTNDEKKKNAEVPTPVILVDDMLNKVPIDFWTFPHAVFEPCCGKGNFVLGIFDKFYEGLKEMYPDEIERCEVIITQCIYYGDITALNVFITTEILKCHIQSYCGLEELNFEFNNFTGDSLLLDIEKQWQITGFHAVIGNPPYNSSGDTATGNTIWQDFTKNSLNKWLLPDGYLLFVHPPGWRKPNTDRGKFTKMYDLMTKKNQMLYLEIHGIKDGLKMFNCGTRYDWYLIERKERYKNTTLIDIDNIRTETDLSLFNWLPNNNILIILDLINSQEKIDILCDFSYSRLDKKIVSDKKTSEFNNTLVYLTPKKGIRYMYSKVNNKGHFGISKVIVGETGMENAINDFDGNYGMTQDSFGILINTKQEGDNIIKALNNPIFVDLIRVSCCWSNFRIDYRLFKEFKKGFWEKFI